MGWSGGWGAELWKLDLASSLKVSTRRELLSSPCHHNERDTGRKSGASGRMDFNKRNVATCENPANKTMSVVKVNEANTTWP